MKANIYLIPSLLGDVPYSKVIPEEIRTQVKALRYFIVEDLRSARRYLKHLDREINIDELVFFELNEHTRPEEIEAYIKPATEGNDIGIISEAGCPGVADPGADVVRLAHMKGIRVIPMVGPSSILLAMMASGFNGQSFAFNGYLPVKKNERQKRIRQLEARSATENQTQIFIEAPYRNMQMLQDLIETCDSHTMLCVACDLTLDTEFIRSLTIEQWKKMNPELHKRPAIFLLYRR
ncbi:MAG: SAM-dependent methyltransferase [Bacteroidota bacterium]|nr:SAM-dependent methyltransferase [Bacteroidota bacterium]